jgi:hypothetical protein
MVFLFIFFKKNMKALFLVPLKQLHFIMFVLDCFDLGKKKGFHLMKPFFVCPWQDFLPKYLTVINLTITTRNQI